MTNKKNKWLAGLFSALLLCSFISAPITGYAYGEINSTRGFNTGKKAQKEAEEAQKRKEQEQQEKEAGPQSAVSAPAPIQPFESGHFNPPSFAEQEAAMSEDATKTDADKEDGKEKKKQEGDSRTALRTEDVPNEVLVELGLVGQPMGNVNEEDLLQAQSSCVSYLSVSQGFSESEAKKRCSGERLNVYAFCIKAASEQEQDDSVCAGLLDVKMSLAPKGAGGLLNTVSRFLTGASVDEWSDAWDEGRFMEMVWDHKVDLAISAIGLIPGVGLFGSTALKGLAIGARAFGFGSKAVKTVEVVGNAAKLERAQRVVLNVGSSKFQWFNKSELIEKSAAAQEKINEATKVLSHQKETLPKLLEESLKRTKEIGKSAANGDKSWRAARNDVLESIKTRKKETAELYKATREEFGEKVQKVETAVKLLEDASLKSPKRVAGISGVGATIINGYRTDCGKKSTSNVEPDTRMEQSIEMMKTKVEKDREKVKDAFHHKEITRTQAQSYDASVRRVQNLEKNYNAETD